ncbi:hypothetical protein Tco_0242509 [Tanacetum coccineum]
MDRLTHIRTNNIPPFLQEHRFTDDDDVKCKSIKDKVLREKVFEVDELLDIENSSASSFQIEGRFIVVENKIGRIKKGLALKVIEICKVPLAIGKHFVTCDVVDIEKSHFPPQPATTEISGEDGSNLEDFLIVLAREEVDIIRPIMAVEEKPLMMLGSGPNIIKEGFSNDLNGQHSTDEKMVCAQRRTWDHSITWLKVLKEHLEDKINDNAYVVDLPNTMSISKTFNVSNIYEFYSEDVNEGKHSKMSSSKERGNDEDMIQKLAEEYMVSKNK